MSIVVDDTKHRRPARSTPVHGPSTLATGSPEMDLEAARQAEQAHKSCMPDDDHRQKLSLMRTAKSMLETEHLNNMLAATGPRCEPTLPPRGTRHSILAATPFVAETADSSQKKAHGIEQEVDRLCRALAELDTHLGKGGPVQTHEQSEHSVLQAQRDDLEGIIAALRMKLAESRETADALSKSDQDNAVPLPPQDFLSLREAAVHSSDTEDQASAKEDEADDGCNAHLPRSEPLLKTAQSSREARRECMNEDNPVSSGPCAGPLNTSIDLEAAIQANQARTHVRSVSLSALLRGNDGCHSQAGRSYPAAAFEPENAAGELESEINLDLRRLDEALHQTRSRHRGTSPLIDHPLHTDASACRGHFAGTSPKKQGQGKRPRRGGWGFGVAARGFGVSWK